MPCRPLLIVLVVALAATQAAGAADSLPSEQWARALGRIPVREAPDPGARRIGWLNEQTSFAWMAPAEGPGCEASQWVALVGGGFACLTDTEPTTTEPEPLPRLVTFDPPRPEEWESYLESLTWDRDPNTNEALLPYVYGKRWRRWDGIVYQSLEAWNAGADPVGHLPSGGGRKSHFIAVVETERGPVLVRPDGLVAPVDNTHVYPVDRFGGRDLLEDPVTDGWLAGWVIAYDGADLLDGPDGAVGAHLDYHEALDVRDAGDGWWEVRAGLGPNRSGYLDDRDAMHHWVPRQAPVDVGPDAIWVDIDLDQQVLAIRVGETLRFITLISGGRSGRTPTGLYRVLDKSIHDDMASRSGADDSYHVEEVPWVVHFQYRYALHGTFWHWGFGHRASHGCVNLSPRDAKWVFDAVHPVLPNGWHSVVARPADPGTIVRIRSGDEPVRDRR